ncbi:hypothetical protein Ga0074812_1722 [Parafrankia irregularis]|uniref:Uncharacterized protein n=1 Tax=Parafrankia irregularis TaxID=795642 RepID=A0A0S4R2L5_9ACTN|nr:hypothetical protein [Parafrankia irregularis]CUU61272.1 hypothetical protein Ga0074812_1722 [Parafrankia irregularis]
MPRPTFRTIGTPTSPTADDTTQATSRRPDATTPATAKPGQRSAFTWRLTPEQANQLDGLLLRLREELGVARLDRAAMLTALTGLAAENPAVFGALVARLQDV